MHTILHCSTPTGTHSLCLLCRHITEDYKSMVTFNNLEPKSKIGFRFLIFLLCLCFLLFSAELNLSNDLSLSLSLSLYIYIYIYVCTHVTLAQLVAALVKSSSPPLLYNSLVNSSGPPIPFFSQLV